MSTSLSMFNLLVSPDSLALLVFSGGWAGYAWFARHWSKTRPSVLASTNRIRHQWMLQTTYREVRVLDGVVVQSLSTSPSFFASTTILIIGGLLAVLGVTDRATELVNEIPFAARTSNLVFDLKIIVLLAIFVYGFFRFTWSMRQYTFGALMVASAPEAEQFERLGLSRDAFAAKAGHMVSLAAETFNDGLRAYYFAFAAMAWFISPWLFMLATLAVISVLYRREFHSEVLAVMDDQYSRPDVKQPNQ